MGTEDDGFDDYDKWFTKKLPNTCPFHDGMNWNTWWSLPYKYDENLHFTAWTGMETVKYIDEWNFDGDKPLFLKSSFLKPHSPYDPPQRNIDQVDPEKIKPFIKSNTWDVNY